jgi:hypothetical protein
MSFTKLIAGSFVQNHNGGRRRDYQVGGLANPKVPVIVLTEDERDPFAINTAQAGISAYILRKNISTEVLESVIWNLS